MKDEGRFEIFDRLRIEELFPEEDVYETLKRFDYIESRILNLFPEDKKEEIFGGEINRKTNLKKEKRK